MRAALAVFLSTVMASAAFGQDTTADRIDALEKRVRALEAIIGRQRMPAARIPADAPVPGRATSSAEAEDKRQMLLKLTKWSASIKEGQYTRSYYEINYTLLNNYDKPVKLIDGSIRFFDLSGADIINIKLDRYAKIEPGKEASLRTYHGIDKSIDSEMKLKELALESVHAQLEVKKIMFRDNTIIDLR